MIDTTAHDLNAQSATLNLLTYYCLEPDHYHTKVKLLGRWLRIYPEQWVRWALIESLYQGRYKPYCVEQILALWYRRGQPLYHFNHEFEAMICHNVPQPIGKGNASNTAVAPGTERSPLPSPTPTQPNPTPEPSGKAEPTVLPVASLALTDKAPEPKSEPVWDATLVPPRAAAKSSVLDKVLAQNQFLPLSLGRLGLEPIHQFMPEAEPIEFCEKLDAIARCPR